MKPETIKALQQNSPEFKELLTFLATEAQKLNTLDMIDVPRADLALEVLARKLAYKAITSMLSPLLGTVQTITGVDPKEYAVDVELSTPPGQNAGTPG